MQREIMAVQVIDGVTWTMVDEWSFAAPDGHEITLADRDDCFSTIKWAKGEVSRLGKRLTAEKCDRYHELLESGDRSDEAVEFIGTFYDESCLYSEALDTLRTWEDQLDLCNELWDL